MRIFAAIPFALFLFSGSAFGWGCEGHQMVALIAHAHLTPEAAQAVDNLLRNNPIDAAVNRYCKDRPADPMADASTWADDVRATEKNGPWHYIDIPLAFHQTATADVMMWCPPIGPAIGTNDRTGCVVNALQYEWTILRQNATQAATRAKALRYVIHFVGDLHQPLHTTDNNDRGGNCTVINFFSDAQATNLHSIWDTKIIQRELAEKKMTQEKYAEDLDRRFSKRWEDWGTAKTGIAEWVWEGHRVATEVTYGDLKPAISVEDPDQPTDCDEEKARVAALHIAISGAYFDRSVPATEEQLVKAGYRLASILNQTFTPPEAKKN
jgi:hypothetical protein